MRNKKRLLVVDDEEVIRETLGCVLREKEYEVVTACDGVEALEYIYQEKIDLIVLDIMMPDMDGYQVCRLLRNDESYKNIPIIMLTAKSEKSQKFWGLKTGADEYITKPFDPEELLNKIGEILKE
ncbi:MAG: response regulator [bacterium]|nr:response regulator [bacterium]